MKGLHYPSWRYHAVKTPYLVKDAQEDAALGEEWADTPAAFEGKDKGEIIQITTPPRFLVEAKEEAPKRGRKPKDGGKA